MINKKEKRKGLNLAVLTILSVFSIVALLFNSKTNSSCTLANANAEVNSIANKYNIPKSTVEVISNNGGFTVEVPEYADCKSEIQNVYYLTKINGYSSTNNGIKIVKNPSERMGQEIYVPNNKQLKDMYEVITYYVVISNKQSPNREQIAQFKISLTCISEEMLTKYDALKKFNPEEVEIQISNGWVNPYIDGMSIYNTDVECEITSTTVSEDDPIHKKSASGEVTIEFSPKYGEIDSYANLCNKYYTRYFKAFAPVKKTYYIKGTVHDDKYWREQTQYLLTSVANGKKTLSSEDTKELLTMYNNGEVYTEEDMKGLPVSTAKKIYSLGTKVGVTPKILAPECDLILLKPKAWNRFPLDTCYLDISNGWATFFYSPFTIGGSGKKWGSFNGSKGSGYSGINFQVSTTKSFKKLKYNKHYGGDDEEHSFMLKGTKKGKTYYVRIRTYKKMANGRVYGTFSPVYKFKVKRNSYTTNAYQHDWETASDPSDCELLD